MRLLFQNRQTLLPSFLPPPPPSKTVAVGYFYSKRHLVQAKQLSESCRQDDDDASLRWPFVIIIFLFFVYRRTVTQLRPRLNVLLLFNFRFKKRMTKTYRAVCCWKKKLKDYSGDVSVHVPTAKRISTPKSGLRRIYNIFLFCFELKRRRWKEEGD